MQDRPQGFGVQYQAAVLPNLSFLRFVFGIQTGQLLFAVATILENVVAHPNL